MILLVALIGCETTPGPEVLAQKILISDRVMEGKSKALRAPPLSLHVAEEKDYRVGAGDVLSINIFEEEGMADVQARVSSEGTIQLPIIEIVNVAGKTTNQIQVQLKELFLAEFNDPWVVVRMGEFGSKPLYLLGEFNAPGIVYMDRATNIVQAIGKGQGLSQDAYLPGARLLRDSNILPVDINSLLKEGQFQQNVNLLPGDTIYVPSKTDLKIYVIGAVSLPGTQTYSSSPTLLKALAYARGPNGRKAHLSETRILRAHSATLGELIEVDLKQILDGKKPDVKLAPGDVIYIPNSKLASWNELIAQLQPTLELIGGTLEPFVQLEVLKDEVNDS
jgi:polysaccharide export outer membrane protein